MTHTDSYLLGQCSEWFANQLHDEGSYPYSFLQEKYTDILSWKKEVREIFANYLLSPTCTTPSIELLSTTVYDDLHIEKIRWKLPFGPPSEAYLLKPLHHESPLPGILALHGHGRNKMLGKSKIVRVDAKTDSNILSFQKQMHDGKAWANELAKKGYIVLIHDVFPFESRRIMPSNVYNSFDDYAQYNELAYHMESEIAKVIAAAGFTWPGITLAEDLIALQILSQRDDVDTDRLGCCGLSLGGHRAYYLAAYSDMIKCTVAAGLMITWNDLILHHAIDHTWMYSIPGLSKWMGFSDIVSMSAPHPLLVQSCIDDELYSLSEVKKAEKSIRAAFEKANCSDHYDHRYYKGSHRFSIQMQMEAFQWFTQWL